MMEGISRASTKAPVHDLARVQQHPHDHVDEGSESSCMIRMRNLLRCFSLNYSRTIAMIKLLTLDVMSSRTLRNLSLIHI